MTIQAIALRSLLFLPFLASAANAQTPLPPFATWTDSCAYPITIPLKEAPEISRLLEAEALLIPAGQISRRTDNPSYFRFNNTSSLSTWGSTSAMCSSSKFYGETRMAGQGRSGYLVAPNIIATASHSFAFDPSGFVVVFNVRAGPKKPFSCAPPDPEYIHEDNVYFPRMIDPLITNGMAEYGDALVDYAAFYLDRPVSGNRRFVRLRRDSKVDPADSIAMASHPQQLRTKFQYGIKYLGEKQTPFRPYSYHSFTDFHVYPGSSGAAAYNLTRGYVESSIGNIHGAGCTIALWENEGTPSQCVATHDGCHESWPLDTINQPWDEINAAPIAMFSTHVPTPELRVAPLADVTHVLAVGAAPTVSTYTYTASASPYAPTPTHVSMDVVADPVPMLQATPINQMLSTGVSTSFNVIPFVPTGTTCGTYNRSVRVTDFTNGFSDFLRHRFEIGLTEVEISPDIPSYFQGIVPPSVPAAITYTLTNKRPTPVTIHATTTEDWLRIGSASTSPPGAAIWLAAAGSPGDTQTIAATIDAFEFTALTNGSYAAEVVFTDSSACAVQIEQRRAVTFDKGKLRLEKYVDELIASPTPLNQPFTSTVSVPEAFCITNMEVGLKTGTTLYIGRDLELWVTRLWLSITKQTGVESRGLGFWMQNSLPLGWVVPEYYDSVNAMNFQTLLIQSTGNIAPFGGGFDDYFTGVNAQGDWTLRIDDKGDANPFTEGYLHSWYLDIEGSPGICPN